MVKFLSTALLILYTLCSAGLYAARPYVHIVGSSTVFPIVSFSAEEFGRKNRTRIPVVESTGTGSGFKLFCAGVGDNTPDIVTASRKMSAAEIALCNRNTISDVLEIKIGYDGIVIASAKNSPLIDFTKVELFLALSSYIPQDDFVLVKNPNHFWSDINPHFPNTKIEIYGPARDTGTYDAITSSILLESCMQLKAFRINYGNRDKLKQACSIVRDDGQFIEMGGSDENLIVQKIIRNHHIIGIFGYNFLKKNLASIQGNMINSVEPTYENIASGKYALSRPLYLYVKVQHFDTIKWLKKFIQEITNEVAIGGTNNKGYLISQGLIPLSKADLDILQEKVRQALQ